MLHFYYVQEKQKYTRTLWLNDEKVQI